MTAVKGAPVRVAVVGAGVAGLACAEKLALDGASVTVFDKGRSVGGRLAARRIPPHTFDLGAQYFTARDAGFQARVRAWIQRGVAAEWSGRIVGLARPGGELRARNGTARYVGAPDMSAVGRELAAGIAPHVGHRVERIERDAAEFVLSGSSAEPGVTLGPAEAGKSGAIALGRFDFVALCIPSPQAATLLSPINGALAARAHAVTLEPCFALGFLASDADTVALRALPFDGAFVGREETTPFSTLTWVARDSSKPGRPAGERWVLHASAKASMAWALDAESEVAKAMLDEFSRLIQLPALHPETTCIRRWALARAPHPLEDGALFDQDQGIGLAGDWACGGRVEGAYLSGRALAHIIAARW